MISRDLHRVSDLRDLYEAVERDPDFAHVLDRIETRDDSELADLIEADGRLRLRLNRSVKLRRYLAAVPDLPSRAEAIDAAIDVALRGLSRSPRADPRSVEAMVADHPHLEVQIREAAALSNALWSTRRVRRQLERSAIEALPCDFGPVLASGARRYEIRELLGEGAFGQVYVAVDRQLSEEDHPALVSIKILSGSDRAPWARQRLTDEATKARRINHPNVVGVLDRGVSEQDEDYIVCEFVDGGDLARWVRRRSERVGAREAARLVASAARGVHAVHMAGLVHCDLKPSNIVITTEGDPKVADFGIAIRTDEDAALIAETDGRPEPQGNLAFMSPEQYRMEPGALTIPSDIYALGGVLYWMLTGKLPNGSTPEEIRQTHDPVAGRAAPPALGALCPDGDRDLEAIAARALAVRPDDRYGSAEALAEDLETWLRREAIAWTRPSLLRRFKLWCSRKPGLAAAVLLVVILMGASAITLNHFAAVADERRIEAALAETRLEAKERGRVEALAILDEYILDLERASEDGLASSLFMQIWLTEWLYGPTVLGEGPGRISLWRLRLAVLRDLVERAYAAGHERDLHTLIWESALGFWLIRDGSCDEAEAVLARNEAKWRALLDPSDPFLDHLNGMRACAAVDRIAASGNASDEPVEGPLDLQEIAGTLEELDRSLDAESRGTPLHRLILSHLVTLYGPTLLDRPERLTETDRRLQEILEEATATTE